MDGNRTRQVELLSLVGFEDRGDHQDAYTSVYAPYEIEAAGGSGVTSPLS